MSAKRWWPWPRPTSTSEPVAQELAPAPEPAAPFVTQTSLYRFQFALENLFRPYLEQKNQVTLDGRVLSLDQICRESGLLGAWVALVDLQAQTQNKTVVTRWGRHGGLVDLLPLGWRSDQVDVEASLVALVAPWLEKSHVELGGVFLPVAEGAALGKLVGVPPSILNWKHPKEAEMVDLTTPGLLAQGKRLPESNEIDAIVANLTRQASWPASPSPPSPAPAAVPPAPASVPVNPRVVGRRYLWCRTGVPPVRGVELDLYEATVNRLEQGLDVIGWPHPDVWRGLRQEFPWALAACQEIEKLAELAHFVKQPGFRLPPLLLVGAPGNGKTRLAERLAEIAGVPRFGISGAGRNNGQVLVGVGRSWSNCQPGGLLQFIAKRGVANPVVVLDELDKASQQTQYGDLASALLPFLEPESAKAVTDDFLMGETDMSGVSWIATANDASVLPGPLLSRFKVIEVGHPSWDHLPVLCEGIRWDLARQFEVPVGNLPEFTPTDLARLRKQMGPTFSARQARLACEAVLAERARMGRLEMVR